VVAFSRQMWVCPSGGLALLDEREQVRGPAGVVCRGSHGARLPSGGVSGRHMIDVTARPRMGTRAVIGEVTMADVVAVPAICPSLWCGRMTAGAAVWQIEL
jgi:hypothetical protein